MSSSSVGARDFDAQVTFCYTADLDTVAAFYEYTLGLPLVLDQGVCRIYRVREGAFLGFCARDDAPRPEGVILTLVADDVDARWRELQARGVVFEAPPARNPRFNIYHCFFRDPAGYLLEIQRFDDPAWRAVASRYAQD